MEYLNYIKPELLILIAVLYVLGLILKSTQKIKDNYIPLIIGIAGIALATLYVIAVEGCTAIAIFTAITQGILVAGAAVYTNQLIKQIKEK